MKFRTVLQLTPLMGMSIVVPSLIAQAPAGGDGNWPKEIVTDQIHLLLYQPQADTWKDNRIEARSAVMMTQLGDPKQMCGMILMSARTEVDRETRTVSFEDINIKEVNLPSPPDPSSQFCSRRSATAFLSGRKRSRLIGS